MAHASAVGEYGLDIRVPWIALASLAAIFRRKHNWIMCVLYLGTFGSFIGFSAGLPLLIKSQFPDGAARRSRCGTSR